MKNKTIFILLGIFVGFVVFFFIPVFPVSFPNINGTEMHTTFFSGLKLLNGGYGAWSFALHQLIGGVISFVLLFIIIKDGD